MKFFVSHPVPIFLSDTGHTAYTANIAFALRIALALSPYCVLLCARFCCCYCVDLTFSHSFPLHSFRLLNAKVYQRFPQISFSLHEIICLKGCLLLVHCIQILNMLVLLTTQIFSSNLAITTNCCRHRYLHSCRHSRHHSHRLRSRQHRNYQSRRRCCHVPSRRHCCRY